MDRDYIWEGEYGRRSHLIPVFQQLLREQDASSLQMLSLFVNNNPYNLEFFIAVSYDRPKEELWTGCSVFWRTLDCGSGRT